MKVQVLVPLSAAVALGTALAIDQSEREASSQRRPRSVIGRPDVLHRAYAQWKAEHVAAAGGTRALVFGLEWTKALSAGTNEGGGDVRIGLDDGLVEVVVRGLCASDPLDFWIVDNTDGGGRTMAPEAGDRMVRLGALVPTEIGSLLRAALPATVPADFQLDLAVVTRAGTTPAEEGLLYGAPDLFQRLFAAELRAGRADPGAGRLGLALIAPVQGPGAEADGGSGPGGPIDDLVAYGEQLFFEGTFDGNGRTCGTCHPATNNLTLDPEFIATMPDDDPLFIAEDRPGHPFPSLVFERPESQGHRFENPILMRGQALICENLDGFASFAYDEQDRFTMRGVPHVFAQRVTIRAPDQFGPPLPKERTGWSGDGAPSGDPDLPGSNGTLRFFAAGAVRQHFTRGIQRLPGIDFTFPTDQELDALEAFQLTLGRQQDLDLAALVLLDPDAQFGKDLFEQSRCNKCHSQAGAGEDGSQNQQGIRINQNFNTGVERFLANNPDDTGEPRPPDGGFGTNPQGDFTSLVPNPDPADGIYGNKEFNTVSLVEMADTLPAFHNNITSISGSTALENTVEGAILFYRSGEFDQSPSGPAISFGAQGTMQVGKFLRVINALHNKDESHEYAKRAHDLIASGPFDPAFVNELLRVAAADAGDGFEVLLPVGLHPVARQSFLSARQHFEGAMAGSPATRLAKIEIGLEQLELAQADMRQ